MRRDDRAGRHLCGWETGIREATTKKGKGHLDYKTVISLHSDKLLLELVG